MNGACSVRIGVPGFLWIFAVACSIGARPYLATAQSVTPLPIESALKTISFGDLAPIALSPDGQRLAYTTRSSDRALAIDTETWLRTGVRDLFTGTDIRILDVDTGKETDLTGGQYDNFMPTWCAKGRDLVYLSDRDGSGTAKVWIWKSATDEMRKLADTTVTATEIACTPDGLSIVVTIPPERSVAKGQPNPSLSLSEPLASGIARRPYVRLYRSDGLAQADHGEEAEKGSDPWSLDWAWRRVAMIDVNSGRLTVVAPDDRVMRFRVSPDGRRIAYSAMDRFESAGSQQILFDLKVVDLSSGTAQVVARNLRLGFNGYFAWSPDSSHLSYREFGLKSGSIDCHVVNVMGGTPQNIRTFQASHCRKGRPVRLRCGTSVAGAFSSSAKEHFGRQARSQTERRKWREYRPVKSKL